MSFVVATWNVQWQFGAWEARQPAITSTLQALAADVIMVQESWRGQVEKLARFLRYDHVWAGHESARSGDRAMGNGILSRWPIVDHDHCFLEERDGRRFRTVVAARITTPFGVLPAFSTHLNHRFDESATRISQLTQVSRFVEEHSADSLAPILAGDMNAVPDSDEIRKLTGRSEPYVTGRVWSDAWELVGSGPGLTWSRANPYINHSAWPNRRIDYVLIGWPRDDRPIGNPQRAWLFGDVPVHGVTASDHYGVAVEIAN